MACMHGHSNSLLIRATTPCLEPSITAAPSVVIPITFLFQLSLKVSVSKSQMAFGIASESGLPKKVIPQNEC